MGDDNKMDQQETEVITTNAVNEMHFSSSDDSPTEPFNRIDGNGASDSAEPNKKPYWYQRLGRSVGGSIAACVSALVVVALVSGFSAFAGASVATGDERHDLDRMERSLDRIDGDMPLFDQKGDIGRDSNNMNGQNDMESSKLRDLNSEESMADRPAKDKSNSDERSENTGTDNDSAKSKNADRKSGTSDMTTDAKNSEVSA